MVARTCKDCGRLLIEEEDKYCPHCTAKRAGRLKKVGGGIIGALGTLSLLAAAVGRKKGAMVLKKGIEFFIK